MEVLPGNKIYQEDLGFAVSVILSPLKSFIDKMYQRDDSSRNGEIAKALFEHAEDKLQDTLEGIFKEIGVIYLHATKAGNIQHLEPGSLLNKVELVKEEVAHKKGEYRIN